MTFITEQNFLAGVVKLVKPSNKIRMFCLVNSFAIRQPNVQKMNDFIISLGRCLAIEQKEIKLYGFL